MVISHYVGVLKENISFEFFVQSIKEKAAKEKLPVDKFKAEPMNSTVHIFCHNSVANLIRQSGLTDWFRCHAIGESDFPVKKQSKKKNNEDGE